MSDKFQNKYRISSARLQNWDYGSNAIYFVTICTQNRECYLGEIIEARFITSDLGKIANHYWNEIPLHFPYVKLGEFVVMPNHIHGIIIIDKPDYVENGGDGGDGGHCRDAINRVSTMEPKPEPIKTGGFAGNKNPMVNNNLSRIIRWYKGRVSFESRKLHANFTWQSRFYEHIVRNDESFHRISNYILNNPSKWTGNKFFE